MFDISVCVLSFSLKGEGGNRFDVLDISAEAIERFANGFFVVEI